MADRETYYEVKEPTKREPKPGDQVEVFISSGFDDDPDDYEIRRYHVKCARFERTSEGWFQLGTRAQSVRMYSHLPHISVWYSVFLTEAEALEDCRKRNKEARFDQEVTYASRTT